MGGRSTRNKLRWQVERAINNVDRAVEHLALMDSMAQEQSPYINKYVPSLVVMLGEAVKALTRFREGL